MKKQFLLLAGTVFTTATLFAQTGQISNNSFDTWTNAYNPDSWTTSASGAQAAGSPYSTFAPSLASAATKDQTDFVAGTASIKLTTIADPAASFGGPPTLPGVVGLGALNTAALTSGGTLFFEGSAFPYKPDTISFQYKYEPAGTDTATLILQFTRQGTDVAGGMITQSIFATSGWQTFSLPISSWTDAPDTAIFQISSGWVQGSILHVDSLHFGYVTPPVVIPAASIAVSVDTINAGETAYFIATLDQATTVDLTVDINPGGTAVLTTDFTPSANSFSFAAGETVDTITVTTTASSAGKNVVAPLVASSDNSYTLGASNSATLYIKSVTTGIKTVNTDLNAIKLYPNPTSSAVTVEVPSEVDAQNITIVDMAGRAVKTVNNLAGKTSVNVDGLTNGNYLVTFTNATTKAFTGSKTLQVKK